MILLLMTVRCTTDLPMPEEPQSRTQTVSIWQVPGLLNAISPYVNPALADRGHIGSANSGNNWFGMNIDFEAIRVRMDSLGYTNYAFHLEDNDGNPTTLKNLVIGRDENGQWRQPYLMTYTMSSEFYPIFRRTHSMEDFTGKVKKETLLPLNTQNRLNGRSRGGSEDPDDHGSDRDQPNTTCPLETEVSSGGTTTTPSTGGTLYEICEVVINTVYTTDGHGNRYIWDTYITYENCETVEIQTSSDAATCENPDGEIPVNTGGDDPDKPSNDSIKGVTNEITIECLKKQIDKIIANQQGHSKLTQDLQDALNLLGEGELNIDIVEDSFLSGTISDATTRINGYTNIEISINQTSKTVLLSI